VILMKSLSAIVRYGNVFSNRHLKAQNISSAEHPILMFLSANKAVNQEAIANYFMLDKGTVAKTLLNLEGKGLILRTENPHNRREKLISLTRPGIENICAMRQLLEEWNAELYKGISIEEQAAFNSIINKMAENAKHAIDNCEKDNQLYTDYEGA